MAIMIPGEFYADPNCYSPGEELLYGKLKQLSDDYYVFHSTQWNEKRRRDSMRSRNYIQWGEADFTVFHPSYGIIVFEVKGGDISITPQSGWTQTNRRTGEAKHTSPMQQAIKSVHYFKDRLDKIFGGTSPYFVCGAVWFPDTDRDTVIGSFPPAYTEELVLWGSDLTSTPQIERRLKLIFESNQISFRTANAEITKQVVDTIAPEFGAFQSLRTRAMMAQILFHRMTREQSYLLDYLEEQQEAAIHGVAGTGKTVLAVQKAQRLAEEGDVLFLCFNRQLKEHLEEAYPTKGIDFYTLDGFLVKMTRRELPQITSEKEDAILELLMDWQHYSWPYRHIVIDEGQDFNDDHLRELHEIAQQQDGCFYVFYDRNQFVQGLEFPKWLEQMECRLVLSRNCRNTKEIAMTSTRPIGLDEKKVRTRWEDTENPYLSSPKPFLFFAKDVSDLKDKLLKLLTKYKEASIKRENIVVLTCKSHEQSVLQESDLILTPYYRLSQNRKKDCVLFTTVRKFKGLEAEAVICIDIDENTFRGERERKALYVGASRATTSLDLISLSDPTSLACAMTNSTDLKSHRSIKVMEDFMMIKRGIDSDLM